MDDAKRRMILGWLERIERSKLTITAFFKEYEVPFSKAQYFIYKKQFALSGPEGLQDRRRHGGNRKLSEEAEGFLFGCVKSNPDVTLEWLQRAIRDNFDSELNRSTISRAIKRVSGNQVHLPRGRRKSIPTQEVIINPVGGFEIIVAIAYHLGWAQRVAEIIFDEIKAVKSTRAFKINAEKIDKHGRYGSGKFSPRYNQRQDVRDSRFAAISEKRKKKNWQSMDIVRDDPGVLVRKSLAVLSLPIITMNGNVRSVDLALGDSLKHLCGFNYKQSTIAKYLSELKYLGVSTRLLKELPDYWRQCCGEDLADSMKGPLLCYYIDGNTKAVWSSQRVKQNKVTMLGRVMGCLEQVFIHDGFGHPIYFETFSGHGPVGEHILGLFEKIEDAIVDVPRSSTKVYRAIVMDSASNSVKALRAFADQKKYYYVTPLDDNQWDERKVIVFGSVSRYKHGNATLRELEIELEDSKEKGYLIRSRAIKIDWDNGKLTVLLTNLPAKIVDASDVVLSYFRRWPAQELQFRYKKAVVSLNRVAGYGRKKIENPRVLEAQRKAAKKIEELSRQLEKPFEQISIHEKSIADIIPKERQIRAQGTIRKGKRILSKKLQQKLENYGKKIDFHKRAIKKIEKEHGNKFKPLRKNQKEWLRLQGKEKVYEIDVELDQIVTFHRISLANLMSYFMKHFLDGASISMVMLLHRIIHLQATIEESNEVRKVKLKKNDKDPEMMRKLSFALEKLNRLCIQGPRGKHMKFSLI
jgi:hypothetical protein